MSTEYLRRRGASKATSEFRKTIHEFLRVTSADLEIVYSLMNDLSKKMDHPFYGTEKIKVNISRSKKDIIKEYCRLLIDFDNILFSKQLLRLLNSQQTPTLRKLPSKNLIQKGRKKGRDGIWEHPTPVKCVVEALLKGDS